MVTKCSWIVDVLFDNWLDLVEMAGTRLLYKELTKNDNLTRIFFCTYSQKILNFSFIKFSVIYRDNSHNFLLFEGFE